jgi:hypothetical protein
MGTRMITIESVTNGFVVRNDEIEETLVFQKEYNSKNMGLLAVFKYIAENFEEPEQVKIKLDFVHEQ